MREWNFVRNDALGLRSEKITVGSNRKVWWKCSVGHEWEMSPVTRYTTGQQCPYCRHKRVLLGFNDLITLYPEVARDWDAEANRPLCVTDVIRGSIKKVHWVCSVCGHKWMMRVRDRTLKGSGCPECAKKKRAAKRIQTVISKRGCFDDVELLRDWDYTKNMLAPERFAKVSNKSVHWKCHVCGYEWKAKISNRVHGRGCPACSGKAVHEGRNDLGTTDPDLAKEWHPTKNGALMPSDVTRGCNKKVWWKCPIGHEYQATPNHRTSSKTGCPVCYSGRQTSFAEQAIFFYLKKVFPDTINRYRPEFLGKMELDIYIPSLRLGIEYDGEAWHRKDKKEREQRKCALCHQHGIKLWRIKERADSADDWISFEQNSYDYACHMDNLYRTKTLNKFIPMFLHEVAWRCGIRTHRISVDVERDRMNIRNYMQPLSRNSIAETFPAVAKEWHPTRNGMLKPEMFTRGSDHKAWWGCPTCGHEYEASILHRTDGTGCPKCKKGFVDNYRRNRIAKVGCLTDEKLLVEWNFGRNKITPQEVSPGCSDKVWWRCSKCGYEWEAKVSNRTHGRGCPCCANRVVVKGKNDLATLYPQLCNEWDYERNGGLKPEGVVPGSNRRIWWKCSKCGYEYQASPNRRTSQGSGCRKCADKEIWVIRRRKMNQSD